MQERIKYSCDLTPFLKKLCTDYKIGDYLKHKIVTFGYEDLNIIIETAKDKYFLKIFADFRNNDDCALYVKKIEECLKAGVSHPKLFSSPKGNIYIETFDGYEFRLALMEYINGGSFFESKSIPSEDEKRFIISQAIKINSLDFKPAYVYDSWALVNFEKEYTKTKPYLSEEIVEKLNPLLDEFKKLDLDTLPHCFVHGDIMTTNVIRDENGKLYIIDFGCSNYYPRIVELAVLLCDFLLIKDNNNDENYQLLLEEYQKKIKLTDLELKTLPLFIKIAFAMYLICGTYEKEYKKNKTDENHYWINLGRSSLGLDKI